MGAQRRRRPAGGDCDQGGHHQDRGHDQHEQSRPHAREAAGGAVVAPVRDVADEPVDGRAGDLAEPWHGHGDADDQGEQRNAPDAVAAELGAHDRVAGPQEDGGRHGLQHAPRRRGPGAGGAIPRPADRHGGARAQAHGGDPGEGNSGGGGCELLGAADRRARGRRGEQHQRRGRKRDEGNDDGRARCAQECQNDHRLHGRRRQEDGYPAGARTGMPGTDLCIGGSARDCLIQGSSHHSDPSSTSQEPAGTGDASPPTRQQGHTTVTMLSRLSQLRMQRCRAPSGRGTND